MMTASIACADSSVMVVAPRSIDGQATGSGQQATGRIPKMVSLSIMVFASLLPPARRFLRRFLVAAAVVLGG
jgi:hypothetical protein